MDTGLMIWYGMSSFLLGLLLFFPLRTYMLAISVNRYQRRTQQSIEADVLSKLKQRIYLYAAVVAVTFAFLYNRLVVMTFFG